jgi:hypothetical protein
MNSETLVVEEEIDCGLFTRYKAAVDIGGVRVLFRVVATNTVGSSSGELVALVSGKIFSGVICLLKLIN